MKIIIPDDEKVLEVLSDVVIRFREHEQYGSRNQALKALSVRCSKLKTTISPETFDYLVSLLDATAELMRDPSLRKAAQGNLAQPEDIDFDRLISSLKRKFPDCPDAVLPSFYNWTLFWHYLK
jgi:hypothetical protein